MKSIHKQADTFIIKLIVFFVLFFFSLNITAQVDSTAVVRDTLGYNRGKMILDNPPSIVELYTFDPTTNRYIFTSTISGLAVNYPIMLTPEEYQRKLLKEAVHYYFKKKLDAMDGKKTGTEAARKNLIPRMYVNSGLFTTIFGSNTIDIKPSGSVEIDLGIRYTQQDNPALSPANRSSTTFDFNQRITLGMQGKVGTRLGVNFNYDTQSTFAFQNLFKLEYNPGDIEVGGVSVDDAKGAINKVKNFKDNIPKSVSGTNDDILQKIEIGNISMPLSSSLIRGAQSLFGVKAQFKFGNTNITALYSEQKSQTKTVTSENGGTVQLFDIFGLDYDADRHFFLSQYFRNNYDKALKSYPVIDSRVQITRIEVWVTNKQNRINSTENNMRNIVAIQDLGEAQQTNYPDNQIIGSNSLQIVPFFLKGIDEPTDNSNNRYNPDYLSTTPPIPAQGILNPNIRDISNVMNGFNGFPIAIPGNPITGNPQEGRDYAKLENARKLTANEFTYHPQLGYISLQQKLANDEVLAVAYQYTIGNIIHQVGEFANDGISSTQVSTTGVPSTQSLILKMLKSSLTNIDQPLWNLMMKNIYQLQGAYQLQPQDFKFNIVYSNPSPLNYINLASPFPNPIDEVSNRPLLNVFNMDKLSSTNDPQPKGDGFFDFIPGLTVDSQNGRIIFTTAEPFGKHLFEKLRTNPSEDYYTTATYNANQAKYVYRSMYKGTQTLALQDAAKNKFELKGKYKSSAGDGIPIGAVNVPKGSVVVTAGGRTLTEGIDYTVNYQQGRVQILDPSLQASGTPIQVSVENNSIFGQQTRRFYGLNIEHKFSDKFMIGGTFLRMVERPLTQKSTYGQESVNNTIYGLNTSFSTEIPFLTRMVNHLPNIDTDVPSNLTFKGEIAYLSPDTPDQDKFNGESTIYVDDFEGSQTNIDMRAPQSWSLSSTPIKDPSQTQLFDDFGGNSTNQDYGFKRALINWYSIDPTFYQGSYDVSKNETRRISVSELYPNQQIAAGQTTVVSTLDLSYYPTERGPYNNAPLFSTSAKDKNFGGLMRSITSTNFEQSNVEYIQFWMLDPTVENDGISPKPTNNGKIFFNLGEISEDVLQDGKKQYENGLSSANSNQITIASPAWGKVPASQSLIYAFDTDAGSRALQDIGFDGLNDVEETGIYTNYSSTNDPANDNYEYFETATGDILNRYKKYNNTQGNSPVDITNNNRGNSTVPDVEDINRDNTMNTINAYYEYSIDIDPSKMHTGNRYVADERRLPITLPDATTLTAHWVLYKIPIQIPESKVGGISDFRSIRFMRMFMTGFQNPLTVRFGSLDLVRGEWRSYSNLLDVNGTHPSLAATQFEVSSVNILENSQRTPIKYVMPPGVVQEQVYNGNSTIAQNEKSLSLRVSGTDGLHPLDSRGVFKNVNIDMRQYKSLKMFMHAEPLIGDSSPLKDGELAGFIRFGNDFTDNFYQVEQPLKISNIGPVPAAATSEREIWPTENELDLSMPSLTALKIRSLTDNTLLPDANGIKYIKVGNTKVGIKGNPNFGLVRTLMVGLKNNTPDLDLSLSARNIKGEAWFDELRIAGIDNKGGMAAVANIDANIADFATVSATGKISTIGFGALEQGTNERSREDLKLYNVVANLSLGQLLPKKWGINLPFNFGVGEQIITPKYDPFNLDIELQQLIDITPNQADKDKFLNRAIDYTKRTSINFIGVKKNKTGNGKAHIYDPENLTLSYSFNQMEHHDFEVEKLLDQQAKTTVDYAFSFQPKAVEPFSKSNFLKKSSYLKLLQDFNFNYLPSSINFSTTILRNFNKQQFRQNEVAGIPLDALFRRNYNFNYNYGFNYNLTKSLKLAFTASTNNIVKSYLDEYKIANPDNTIWTDYWNIGEPNQHNQQLIANYELPLNKISFLSFIKSNYTYTGNYNWQRASEAMSEFTTNSVTYNLGNTIQNSAIHNITADLNMDLLYKFLGLKDKKPKAPKPPTNAVPKPGEKIVAANQPKPAVDENVFLKGLKGVLMSVKNIKGTYIENSGTVLPGYLPGLGFLGTSQPTLGFVFGLQDDVRYAAAQNGWLTNYPNFNQNYTQVTSKELKLNATVDLFPDFKIELSADRKYSKNYSEQYDVDGYGNYNSRSPYTTGNFAISTVMLKTAFKESDENFSTAFNDFRHNRLIIANRLAEERGIDLTNPINLDPDGFPKHIGKNSQAVMLPAFLAAYTGFTSDGIGKEASKISFNAFKEIPLPNWTMKYTGLMRYKFFKDNFKRFSLQHTYRSSYTINSYRSNLNYNETGYDVGGNFLNKILISNINLVEQFNPLISMDFELKSAFKILASIKKDRALSLSFDNSLLTEVQGKEYVVGIGYQIKDIRMNSKFADNATGEIKSDINIKADFSMRNTKTIVRQLDYENNRLAGGQNLWSIKLTADYAFSRNLTAIFFYDHSFNKPIISTSFPLTNIRSGFTIRYAFGN